MRTLLATICCICTMCVYAQTTELTSTDGIYEFQKVTLSIYNYKTKAMVSSKVIEDIPLIDSTSFHFENMPIELSIRGGQLVLFKMINDKEYAVEYGTQLTIVETKEDRDIEEKDKRSVEDNLSDLIQLYPYDLTFNGDRLNLEMRYPFGDSRYNFPLEAKLTIDYIKQKAK